MDELQRALKEAARSHRPDRARMLARVERGMAAQPPVRAPRRPPGPRWARIAAATAAVAAVVAAGGLTARAVLHEDPAPAPVAVPAPDDPVSPPAGRAADGFLRGAAVVDPHSNRYWAQSNITFSTATALRELTVELRVARTGGVAPTGNWRTLPADDFAVSTREEAGALVFTWTLRPGRGVPAGQHVFAAQYNHAEGGRDARGDRYTVTATSTGGARAAVTGGVTAAAGTPR
ncbi:hypothetical protein [Streptomyces sp. DH12]|uniref:hypothetical protein n=1 Tax=Streptomyces sp. DH12 TaxID=2857010 RepID=UPI001E28CF3C|nr:hypothetical protein [Streptomyces sp. DH12]